MKRLTMRAPQARKDDCRADFRRCSACGSLIAAVGVGSACNRAAGPITFESPTYGLGPINSQDGWSDTGGYDASVADVAGFSAAAGYGFGGQALP